MTDHVYTDHDAVLAPEEAPAEGPIDGLMMEGVETLPEMIDGDASSFRAEASDSTIVDGNASVNTGDVVVAGDPSSEDGVERDVSSMLDEAEPAMLHEQAVDQVEAPSASPEADLQTDPVNTGVISTEVLVAELVETAARRRNKRRPAESSGSGANTERKSADDTTRLESHIVSASALMEEEVDETVAPTFPAKDSLPTDDLLDPDWREHWPDNEVRLVGQLLPRVSDAPTMDGVQRTRMEVSLVEHHAGAFGTIANLPVFVMPGASGFTPIYNEIRRARNQDRRLKPILVEMEGILRQMPDRDTRYANERYSVLMGVEVHKIARAASDAEQFGYWRGRVTIIASRRYDYRGMAYQRVTGVVAVKQRKPHLRGTSVTHIPVDFLVAPEHEHADRFQHIGQRLLIEATIAGDVHRMHPDHPDLEGLDQRRKAQLQLLREAVVTVALGEFPDEAAERDYQAWVKAGRPRPRRQPRESRLAVAQHSSTGKGAQGNDGESVAASGNGQSQNGRGAARQNGHLPQESSAGDGERTKARGHVNNAPR